MQNNTLPARAPRIFFAVSILHAMQMLIRQHGAVCEHFNGYLGSRDSLAVSADGSLRAYTLRGDPNRKIWLNGEHVASALVW